MFILSFAVELANLVSVDVLYPLPHGLGSPDGVGGLLLRQSGTFASHDCCAVIVAKEARSLRDGRPNVSRG